jgi:DNA polymerase I-like protein with 3'-5' exonuclease and polymerase domains
MNALFLGTPADEKFTGYLKPLLSACTSSFVILQDIQYLEQVREYCAKKNITKVFTTQAAFLWKLVEKDWPTGLKKKPSINDYAGSFFTLPPKPGLRDQIEIVVLNPLKQCVTKTYGKFVLERHVSKLTQPNRWHSSTAFSFTVCNTGEQLTTAEQDLAGAYAIAIDIETVKQDAAISCVGYVGIFVDVAGNISTRGYVVPFTSTYNLSYVRRLNALPCPKIFQNGKYDNAYFLRFNCPVSNWLWDTAHLFHSWYSELPKDLGFLNAFFLRESCYWKDLAKVGDKYLYYKYNALDAWVTANVWLLQMLQMPAWACKNYTLEFPLVFPCLLSEMTGVRRDPIAMKAAIAKDNGELGKLQSSLNNILGVPYFNTNSPKQMEALFKVLGLSEFAEVSKRNSDGEYEEGNSYNDKVIEKALLAHPFGRRILKLVQAVRKLRKNISTYLGTGEDTAEFFVYGSARDNQAQTVGEPDGRILYSLNPHGTDTARLSSNSHAFWCGFNIQNGPRTGTYKTTIAADDGMFLAECDLKQAESRDTANISGDSALLAALDSENDFHAHNASAFFGKPYAEIFDNVLGKILDKPLRDLSKRTNHGANYNMGAMIMLETMGQERVAHAKQMLSLPTAWSLIRVCEYLLERFHATYPNIAKVYYPWVVRSVLETSKLTSRVIHHVARTADIDAGKYIAEGDWTRYCFGHPDKSKRDLNALVAHVPQSLNGRTLNEAYLTVFYKFALGNSEFRLYAQIHDSILYGFKRGCHAKYCEGVRNAMEIAVTIQSCDSKVRTFTVPADTKAGKAGVGATHWNATE